MFAAGRKLRHSANRADKRGTARELRKFLDTIAAAVPPALPRKPGARYKS